MEGYPEEERINCPRCNSPNTKFCYYNNYNTSQPRHVCKTCKRYWTKGGSLRNIPVGGLARKNKRSSNPKRSSSSTSSSSSASPATRFVNLNEDFSEHKLCTTTLENPISSSDSNAITVDFGGRENSERISVEDSSSCKDGNRWLDLSFSTPGSVKTLVNYL